MIQVILMLLIALTGAAEEAPVPAGEVIADTVCDDGQFPPDGRTDCETTTTTTTPPFELPGPRPI